MDRKMKGLREYQTEKSMESQLSILRVLSDDEDRHRYNELKEKTELSDSTLFKQLVNLEKKLNLIERHKDKKSGEYPYPVYYRLNPAYVNAFRGNSRGKQTWKDLQEDLRERKNLLETIRRINFQNNINLFGILISIKENKNIDDTIKRFLLELLIWKPYKSLIWNLVEEAERLFDVEDLKEFIWDV